MSLIETIIRMFAVLGLSYPFWRYKDVNAKIANQGDVRKKVLMRFVWVHILLYSAILQVWILLPLMNAIGS